MDWSLLRPHAHFMFLREELLYTSHIPVRSIIMSTAMSADGDPTNSFTTSLS